MNNNTKTNIVSTYINRILSNDRLYPVLLFLSLCLWMIPFVGISLLLGWYGVKPVIAVIPTAIASIYLLYKGFSK